MEQAISFKHYKPSQDLSQLIIRFMYNKYNAGKAGLKISPVPTGKTEIYFYLNNPEINYSTGNLQKRIQSAIVVGIEQYQSRRVIDLKNKYETFIVELNPGAFYHIFEVPERELNGDIYNLSLFGKAEICFLTEMINMASTNEARVNIFEAFVRSRIRFKQKYTQGKFFIPLAGNDEVQFVKNICHNNGVNIRKLERKYKEIIGICPSHYLHIRRINGVFQNLHLYKQQGWALLSNMLGYYDQSHFIKDFKSITGQTPTDFINCVPGFFYNQQMSERSYIPLSV
jgi:AraC-like DNA-binding protein